MAIKDALLGELEHEVAATRRMLERVPEDRLKSKWKPAEKSMTLSRLASHVAELPTWGVHALNLDELDIAPPGEEPQTGAQLESTAEIVATFDTNISNMRDAIQSTSDEKFMTLWTLKKSGEDIFSIPKIAVLRNFVINHMVHHRGQLSVFLRLCDVAVPQTYGPTADEPDM
jgi:uncharacterized damage-inducible protein DinB